MRKKPHFLTNVPISRQIPLVFWGRKWQFSFSEKSAKYLRTMKKNRKSAKFERIFPQKKCHFRPQKTSRIQRGFGISLKKCGIFLIRSRQFSRRNDYLGDQLAPSGELQSPDEENRSHFLKKIPIFSSNWGSEIHSKIR